MDIFKEIMENVSSVLPKEKWEQMKEKQFHLGIFTEPYLSYMLEGKKTIESRFSKNRIAPYQQISKDDIVFIKKSGGDVVGYFTIKKIEFYDLERIPIAQIKKRYQKELCVSDSFWKLKAHSHYATLIFIDELSLLKPFSIHKKGMQTWLVSKNDALEK